MLLDLSPLRASRDYRLLFFGQLVSFFGSMMTFIVVPWQMYQLTQSNAMVGYIALAEFVPMFCLAFVGGALADYVDKRRVLRFTEVGQTLLTGVLVLNSLLPTPSIAVLFVVVALHAGLAALQRPAFESFIQKVIPPEMMSAVMALNSVRFHIGMIVGPAIAGIIATQFAPVDAYLIDFATFAASLVAVFRLKFVPPPDNADRPSFSAILRAVKYAFCRRPCPAPNCRSGHPGRHIPRWGRGKSGAGHRHHVAVRVVHRRRHRDRAAAGDGRPLRLRQRDGVPVP